MGGPRTGKTAREVGRRHFTTTFPPEMMRAIYEFMDREQIMTEAAAVVALVRIALASTPEAAMTSMARTQAYNDTRRWLMQQVGLHLKDILHTLEEGNHL